MNQSLRWEPAFPLLLLPPYQQEVAKWIIAPFPNSSWVLTPERGLVGSGGSEAKSEPVPHPHESTVIPTSCKGHVASQVMAPWGCLKMPQASKQEAFIGLCICSCRDMLKDCFTPDSWLPLPNKKDKIIKKNPLCKQHGATDFLGSLSISRGSFYFLSNKSYFVCQPCCLMSQSILWPMEARTLDTSPQQT
jgi:hypothetical protein